jgi:chemotaxis protein MotB
MRNRRSSDREPQVNHERWLVSYADFITLMFAFFVVMFASSHADKEKVQRISAAVQQALEEGAISSRIKNVLGGTPNQAAAGNAEIRGLRRSNPPAKLDEKLAELTPSMRQLTAELQAEIRKGKLQINLTARGLVISLTEAAFFPSGDATIALDSYGTLARLAETIRRLPNPVRLEGHTDSVPINNSKYASNWHLSAARSIAMLELFSTRFAIPPARLGIAGYAETIPIETNETAEGRARNRRVDVTILSEAAVVSEPKALL